MKASVGDRILVPGTRVDDPPREGEVIEVRHDDGSPPFLVRWSDGQTALCFPGPSTTIHHRDS